jgi:hypothetical protein
MTLKEKEIKCKGYFRYLRDKLADTHVLIRNKDNDMYLIPRGTLDQLTNHSKPVDCYRFSDYWNWYATEDKCPDLNYVQCWNVDLPRPKTRSNDTGIRGKASKPVLGICVARYGSDGVFHTVYGEVFNYQKRMWWFREES